jgi:hypothetical protein
VNNIGALRGSGFRLVVAGATLRTRSTFIVAARCARRTLLKSASLAPVSRGRLFRLLVACWALRFLEAIRSTLAGGALRFLEALGALSASRTLIPVRTL